MKPKSIIIDINLILILLLVVFVAVSMYSLFYTQSVIGTIREYNIRSQLVKSDMNNIGTHVLEWRTATNNEDTFMNYPYLNSIRDKYLRTLPSVKNGLIEYKGFVERNSDFLDSVSINTSLELNNVDSIISFYEENIEELDLYLDTLKAVLNNQSASI